MAGRDRKARTAISAADVAARGALIGKLVLDRYVVEAELGAGAMGVVYRGRHAKLPRSVAIKVMHEEIAAEPVLRERFKREGHIAAKLHHANVVTVLDVGELAAGQPVIVMELVDGTCLADLYAAGLPVARMLGFTKQILRGLDHAHGLGLVHRDLKPENVIVERPGQDTELARIVDFGIAVLRSPDQELQRLTGTGMIIGSPLYMAPEQARAEQVDHRADLYALGSMLYEVLAGRPPFDGTAMEVAVTKMDHDPPAIAGLDPVIERYLGKLIARDPDGRFATAHDALMMLELMETDPVEAGSRMGIIDVGKALATISLPARPK